MMNRLSIAIALLHTLALSCGSTAVTAASSTSSTQQDERQLIFNNPLLDNWEKEEGLANLLNEMIESSKTTSPSLSPTTSPTNNPTNSPTTLSPTLSPSGTPSQTPSSSPSSSPTVSSQPSAHPSLSPSVSPTSSPSISASPTAAPSISPSVSPTSSPSTSQMPTSSPSVHPSSTPTSSSVPSSIPTQSPTQSAPPSQTPTETKVMESSVIIEHAKARSATPLLIVGACCFIVMASTSAYLYKRGYESQKRKIFGKRKSREGGVQSMIVEVSSDLKQPPDDIVSPYSIEDGRGGTFDVNYSESESAARVSDHDDDDDTIDYSYNQNDNYKKRKKTNETTGEGEMVDVDLEEGRIGIDAVPNSVSIIHDQHLVLPNTNEESEAEAHHGTLSSWMPRSIYVPKLFQRTTSNKDSDGSKEQIVPTWSEIREQGRSSPASSGYAPASVPSPMINSPFLVKGLSSILSPYGKSKGVPVVNETRSSEEMESQEKSGSSKQTSSRKKKGMKKKRGRSPMKEIIVQREQPSPGSDIFAGLDHTSSEQDGQLVSSNDNDGVQKSLKIVESKSSDGSSIEWGIDVSTVQPSKATFDANMTELKNLMVSIKSLGSDEQVVHDQVNMTSPRLDVQMTYTEDSWDNQQQGGQGSVEQNSSMSDRSTYLGNIAPIESSSTLRSSSFNSPRQQMHATSFPPTTRTQYQHQKKKQSATGSITYQRELLNAANRMDSGEGSTFSFRNIFNDPKNDLYECHAPSGPLGIVVDTTPLGPRVRSLNPLSPIFGNICPGDVIVGVDDVDTVGMEAGEFWQIVSRKANQQQRVLTILRI